MIVISDATPIISLIKIKSLGILDSLYKNIKISRRIISSFTNFLFTDMKLHLIFSIEWGIKNWTYLISY